MALDLLVYCGQTVQRRSRSDEVWIKLPTQNNLWSESSLELHSVFVPEETDGLPLKNQHPCCVGDKRTKGWEEARKLRNGSVDLLLDKFSDFLHF